MAFVARVKKRGQRNVKFELVDMSPPARRKLLAAFEDGGTVLVHFEPVNGSSA